MTRMVQCVKLGKELPGMEYAPMEGDLGERIYNNVSAEGWQLWIGHSTMVINEYRLNPSEPAGRATMRKHIEAFFFGEGAELPPDYVPPTIPILPPEGEC